MVVGLWVVSVNHRERYHPVCGKAPHLRLPVHGNHVRVGVRMRGHPSGRRAIGVVRVAVRVHVLLRVGWG